jgi:AcrR family transcriptional regulator
MTLAVARGTYDRRRSKDERRADRRQQLLQAAADQLCARSPPLNVGELVRRARVDRNAFYELFGDRIALERGLIEYLLDRLTSALSDDLAARTPGEVLRHWLKQWVALLRDERALVLACLNTGGAPTLIDFFSERLERWSELAASSGLIAGPPEALRLQLIAGEIVHAAELASLRKPAELAAALADLVLRGLR